MIDNNQISDKGMEHIAAGLKVNSSIKELWLSRFDGFESLNRY